MSDRAVLSSADDDRSGEPQFGPSPHGEPEYTDGNSSTTPGLRRRQVVLGALCAGVTVASYSLLPSPTMARLPRGTLDSWMPAQIGNYAFAKSSGVVLPPADELADRLYDNIVTRIYASPEGSAVMVMLAYSSVQDGMLQVHRPEFCYTANGFSLTPTSPSSIVDRTGRKLGADEFFGTAADHSEQVLYWTRIGPWFPQTWVEQRVAVMRENLKGRVPDGLVARVSTLDENRSRAVATLQNFVLNLSHSAPRRLQEVLFGVG